MSCIPPIAIPGRPRLSNESRCGGFPYPAAIRIGRPPESRECVSDIVEFPHQRARFLEAIAVDAVLDFRRLDLALYESGGLEFAQML